jgi:hypothetical protein
MKLTLTSHPVATTASRPNSLTIDITLYPAALADVTSQPAALASATVNPADLTSTQLQPAAAQAAASNPAAFSDVMSSPFTAVLPSAARTAFTAYKFRMLNKSRVRANADAMSCSGEAPALAA